MKFLLEKIKVLFSILVLCFQLQAQDFPERPNPPRLVNDYADILNPNQEQSLELKLRAFNDSTSTQIAIVNIQTTNGYEIGDYSFQLAEKWGIGQRGKDNGVLICVALQDRKMFIATGYGVEEFITDAAAKSIVENYMKPAFKASNYYQGLDQATTILMGLTSGQFTADDIKRKGKGSPLLTLLFIVIFAGIIILANYARYKSYKSNSLSTHSDLSFWAFLLLMSQNSRRGGHSGGSFGSFSSGGGSFGGFGGGSFGGGGAGGSW